MSYMFKSTFSFNRNLNNLFYLHSLTLKILIVLLKIELNIIYKL